MASPFTFTLPPELSAKEPPERRGIRRDQVRLLVIERATGRIEHSRFDKIDDYLRAGDLLVFNSSRTLPASLRGCCATHGPCVEVRLAERLPDDSWLARSLGNWFSIYNGAGSKAPTLSCTPDVLRTWMTSSIARIPLPKRNILSARRLRKKLIVRGKVAVP